MRLCSTWAHTAMGGCIRFLAPSFVVVGQPRVASQWLGARDLHGEHRTSLARESPKQEVERSRQVGSAFAARMGLPLRAPQYVHDSSVEGEIYRHISCTKDGLT